MSKSIGYSPILSKTKNAFFQKRKIILKLENSRFLEWPLRRFPGIKQLTPYQRRKHKLLEEKRLIVDDPKIVYHISNFLDGGVIRNDLPMAVEQKSDYRKSHKGL